MGSLVLAAELADCEGWDGTAVLVIGDIECQTAQIRGELLVTGDLVAKEWVYVNSGNDYGVGVGGTLRTKLFLEEGSASFANRFEATVWRTMNAVRELSTDTLLPRCTREQCTRAAAEALGLGPQALDELAELADLA